MPMPASLDFLTQPQFWARWIQIVILDLCLAGDNALVIALAVRRLPARQQFWGRIWGTAGAVVLRVVFIAAVSWLMRIPLLRLAGGVVLLWIAFRLLREDGGSDAKVRQGGTLKEAIGIIILADVVMSLDNVLAIAGAAQGDLVLVVFGLLLSLPLVVWGSGLLARLMVRFRPIIWVGAGVLGFVAAEMILKDEAVLDWLGANAGHALLRAAPWAAGALLTLLGWWLAPRAIASSEKSR